MAWWSGTILDVENQNLTASEALNNPYVIVAILFIYVVYMIYLVNKKSNQER